MKPVLRLFCLCLAGGVILAGCGKKGAPHAPGPADRITYPHTYPPE
ncbi:hypothetical protein [Swaminathania salitolerans]|uniref:Lipoprotein n=1 Tax=Swaminathania salitolerans TaxID=182838 RepID=A0A511BMN8_9PROT|nr:hypothetical protein [Swaminathania salitolerans]GBQ16096.1 hypothetical protein AA21291_2408 [Swaminathania salitolerans LMG 21291]GEL01597.1 hypothetical protein SSA02_07600 [Swaminathania salitolerans]